MESDYERMTATLFTIDGAFVQVAGYARTLGEMEGMVTQQYCLGEKLAADPRLFGSAIVRIVRDDWADQLPEHIHVGD